MATLVLYVEDPESESAVVVCTVAVNMVVFLICVTFGVDGTVASCATVGTAVLFAAAVLAVLKSGRSQVVQFQWCSSPCVPTRTSLAGPPLE